MLVMVIHETNDLAKEDSIGILVDWAQLWLNLFTNDMHITRISSSLLPVPLLSWG